MISYDVEGMRFDMLVACERVENSSDGKIQHRCVCDCGNERIVKATDLRTGKIHSCGCVHWNKKYKNFSLKSPHGKRLYRIWHDMLRRCEDKRVKSYKRYGERGIAVCPEWHDFQAFYDWSLDNGYSEELTLDRVDNNKDYEPDNCRWADKYMQANNRRSNHYITYNGKRQSMKEWSRELNISYTALRSRLMRGWSAEKALTTPIKKVI